MAEKLVVEVKMYEGLDKSQLMRTVMSIAQVVVRLWKHVELEYDIQYVADTMVCVQVSEDDIQELN